MNLTAEEGVCKFKDRAIETIIVNNRKRNKIEVVTE